jgi:hypothetical protein
VLIGGDPFKTLAAPVLLQVADPVRIPGVADAIGTWFSRQLYQCRCHNSIMHIKQVSNQAA